MVHAVHHVRGRLRVRNVDIKGSACDAARYSDVVRCLPGVYAATASALTGSVVIEYDAHITSHETILQLLGASPARQVKRGEKLVERFGQVLVERLIERSASVLIAALI